MSERDLPRPRSATALRREAVRDYLRSLDRSQTVEELAAHFEVSVSTLRRDIDALADQAKVWKIAGGSVTVRRPEPTWHDKALSQRDAKMAIARFAAEHLVRSGEVVLLDSGTTTGALGRLLGDREDLTLVVAGMSPLEAVSAGRADVIVLGGRLRRHSGSFLGALTSQNLGGITPDVAFLGCDALVPGEGVNCPRLDSADFKALAMRRARRSWVLADETKLTGDAGEAYWTPLPLSTGVLTVEPRGTGARERIEALIRDGHRVDVIGGIGASAGA